jgi:hypothetical protein
MTALQCFRHQLRYRSVFFLYSTEQIVAESKSEVVMSASVQESGWFSKQNVRVIKNSITGGGRRNSHNSVS